MTTSKRRRAAPALLGTALLASSALLTTATAAETYAIDPSHARVSFEVGHLGFSDVLGMFDKIDGTLTLDEENPANSSVSITIDAASIDTGWDARDEHIRTPDFLGVEANPEITFESTSVEVTGDDTATVTGDLTLLGQTQAVTLDVTLNQLGANPLSGTPTVGFDATTTIDRTAFGNETYAPAISAELPVTISIEFTKAE